MRRYETTYILRPNLGEEQFTEIIERTNAIVTNDGGAIISLERLGNRKLAYEIKKEVLGQYIYFDFAAPGSTIHEMERIFRIDDRVLRFLTVKITDSIDEETVASETERAAAVAAEKSSVESETEDENTSDETTSEKAADSGDDQKTDTTAANSEEAADDASDSEETDPQEADKE